MSFYCEFSGDVSAADWEKMEGELRNAVSGYDIDIKYDSGVLTISTETDTDAMINDEFGLVSVLKAAGSDAILVYAEDEGAGMKQEGIISQTGFTLLDHEAAIRDMKASITTGTLDDRIEVAQCLWETFLDRYYNHNEEFVKAFGWGSNSMRELARDPKIIDACLEGNSMWLAKAGKGVRIGDFYDDYIPAFVTACIDPFSGLEKNWREKLESVFSFGNSCVRQIEPVQEESESFALNP